MSRVSCCVVLAGLLVAGAQAASAQQASLAISPTESASVFSRQAGRRLVFICPAIDTPSGTVWGTGTYISDSAICVAAVHAGVITLDGGAVTVTRAPGRDTFESTLQNGVQSIGWSAWTDAFRVSAGHAIAGTESTDGSDRIIRLAGYTGSGNGADIVSRKIRIGGWNGTGAAP